MALLWAILQGRISLAGVLLGLSVHFKIYPFIYAPSIIWWLDDEHVTGAKASNLSKGGVLGQLKSFCNSSRIKLTVTSLLTFMSFNALMCSM